MSDVIDEAKTDPKVHFGYWGSVQDLSTALGVVYPTAQSWVVRGRIPSEYDFKRLDAIEVIKMANGEKLPDAEKVELLRSFNDERQVKQNA